MTSKGSNREKGSISLQLADQQLSSKMKTLISSTGRMNSSEFQRPLQRSASMQNGTTTQKKAVKIVKNPVIVKKWIPNQIVTKKQIPTQLPPLIQNSMHTKPSTSNQLPYTQTRSVIPQNHTLPKKQTPILPQASTYTKSYTPNSVLRRKTQSFTQAQNLSTKSLAQKTQKSASVQSSPNGPSIEPSTSGNEGISNGSGLSSDSFMKLILENQRIMCERMSQMEKMFRDFLKQQAMKKRVTAKDLPKCLPFESLKDLTEFDKSSDDEYTDVVNYLAYLGGVNAADAAALYLKKCFKINADLVTSVTWHGSKICTALKSTRFAAACEEAMSQNRNIPKTNNTEFVGAMTKALKSIKEEFRRKTAKRARNDMQEEEEKESPASKRIRISGQENDENANDDLLNQMAPLQLEKIVDRILTVLPDGTVALDHEQEDVINEMEDEITNEEQEFIYEEQEDMYEEHENYENENDYNFMDETQSLDMMENGEEPQTNEFS